MNEIDWEIKARQLDDLIHRIANKINRIEKIPRNYGTDIPIYMSEINTIMDIGLNPGIGVSELAEKQGVTKGAVSQVLAKLDAKKLIIKMKETDNDKTVFLKLSKQGVKAFEGHQAFHANLHSPLVDMMAAASAKELNFLEEFLVFVEAICEKALKEKR